MSDQSIPQKDASSEARKPAYLEAVVRLMLVLLTIWITISYGVGVFFRGFFDSATVFGEPLGVWMAEQGAAYVFLVLVAIYCWRSYLFERSYLSDQSAAKDGAGVKV